MAPSKSCVTLWPEPCSNAGISSLITISMAEPASILISAAEAVPVIAMRIVEVAMTNGSIGNSTLIGRAPKLIARLIDRNGSSIAQFLVPSLAVVDRSSLEEVWTHGDALCRPEKHGETYHDQP